MTKSEILERSVQLTHTLLALPDDIDVIAVSLNDWTSELSPNRTTIHVTEATAPNTETSAYSPIKGSVFHRFTLGDDIELMWVTNEAVAE